MEFTGVVSACNICGQEHLANSYQPITLSNGHQPDICDFCLDTYELNNSDDVFEFLDNYNGIE